MPLPALLIGVAIVSGTTGTGVGIHGGYKMKKANDNLKEAKLLVESAVTAVEKKNLVVTKMMDRLGKKELEILSSFNQFCDYMENFQERPEFINSRLDKFDIPKFSIEELSKVSVGAGTLLSGLGGTVAGVAGGMAASGAATSAVMALGTASTGTAISSLSGVAATNAALAALGGGAIGSSATAGGMALGSTVLGASTLGIGILIGGIIFNFSGKKMSDKSEDAYKKAQEAQIEADKIVEYLNELKIYAWDFFNALDSLAGIYENNLVKLGEIFEGKKHVQWDELSDDEVQLIQNTILMVGVLYKMCRLNIVIQSEEKSGLNVINKEKIQEMIKNEKELEANILAS